MLQAAFHENNDPRGGGLEYLHRRLRVVRGDKKVTQFSGV
jgi:hypothetical protein